MDETTTDVVVIGGGPAGSTVSTLLAQQGVAVTLLEREVFPRFHIGESLIPETYWVLKRLGMLGKMHASPFVKKYSVQFVNAAGRLSAPFYFWDNKPHECSQTWQVVRSQFDQMMLENAREQGVTAHERAHVGDILMDGARAVGVRARLGDGRAVTVHARVVVDASGQAALLSNRLGLRLWDPVLDKAALWTYWQGAHRDTGKDEGATVVLQTADKKGWFWYIPLHDDRISVGVVSHPSVLVGTGPDLARVYAQQVEQCVDLTRRLKGARQVAGLFATRDYSYRSRQLAGDGWVTIGDAFGFLDPLYSSGVLLAMKSGELAADSIGEALAAGDTSAQRLGHWGPMFNQGVDRMRRLVCEYYAGLSFGAFMRKFPDLRGKVTDVLIGDVFNDSVDQLWSPLETLYPEGTKAPAPWSTGTPQAQSSHRVNSLILPDGFRP